MDFCGTRSHQARGISRVHQVCGAEGGHLLRRFAWSFEEGARVRSPITAVKSALDNGPLPAKQFQPVQSSWGPCDIQLRILQNFTGDKIARFLYESAQPMEQIDDQSAAIGEAAEHKYRKRVAELRAKGIEPRPRASPRSSAAKRSPSASDPSVTDASKSTFPAKAAETTPKYGERMRQPLTWRSTPRLCSKALWQHGRSFPDLQTRGAGLPTWTKSGGGLGRLMGISGIPSLKFVAEGPGFQLEWAGGRLDPGVGVPDRG